MSGRLRRAWNTRKPLPGRCRIADTAKTSVRCLEPSCHRALFRGNGSLGAPNGELAGAPHARTIARQGMP